jgi:hypothetical protein
MYATEYPNWGSAYVSKAKHIHIPYHGNIVKFDDRTSYSTNFVNTEGFRAVTSRPVYRRNPIASFDVTPMESTAKNDSRNIQGAVVGAWKVVRASAPQENILIGGPGDFNTIHRRAYSSEKTQERL